jgi:DNA-binding MarR family transcriptional regulator
VRDQEDRRQVIVEITPLLAERAEPIWGPLGEEARAALARLSVEEIEGIGDFFRLGIDLNQRHIDRVRGLSLNEA